MDEQGDWLTLQSQPEEEILDVYIDLKSPHAYLSVRPSLEIARDFKVMLNFMPYTLCYESLGLTKQIGPEKKREPASPAADRKARMYYATAREYAALQSLPLKSPYRLLDSELAHRVFLFAKEQNLEVAFTMCVYLQGWASGWRNFELECDVDLKSACCQVGIDINGIDAYIAEKGEGQQRLIEISVRAETDGVVGVPHYVFNDRDKNRRVGLFGREHLALIRGKYMEWGLARHRDVVAHFSHTWPA